MTLVYPADDFEAYLTAVLETWIHRAPEWAIVTDDGGWFGPEGPRRTVTADRRAAQRIADGVAAQAGTEAWTVLGQAFRHADRGKEALLAEFVRLCVRHGPSVLDQRTTPEVRETLRRSRAVVCEAHRYLGLVRFQAVAGGGWYARYEPDHDVTGMLVGHFHQRLAGQDWMLHDLGRRSAWVSRNGTGEAVFGVQVPETWGREVTEAGVQGLWQQYFQTIAIPNRINPGLQRNKMPRKTWKHLVEQPQKRV